MSQVSLAPYRQQIVSEPQTDVVKPSSVPPNTVGSEVNANFTQESPHIVDRSNFLGIARAHQQTSTINTNKIVKGTANASDKSESLTTSTDLSNSETNSSNSNSLTSFFTQESNNSNNNTTTDQKLTGIPHSFELTYFPQFTFCAFCLKFIWGVVSKQGYSCVYCKYPVHKRCKACAPLNCPIPHNIDGATKKITAGHKFDTMKDLIERMREPGYGVILHDKRVLLKLYHNCFSGSDAIDWMLQHLPLRSRVEAVQLGNRLIKSNFILTTGSETRFKDIEDTYYKFAEHQEESVNGLLEEDSNPKWQRTITADDFETIRLIGRGGFGRVFLVKKKDSIKEYAMKVIHKSKIVKQHHVQSLISEKNIMLNENPYLIHLHYSFQTVDQVYLVMDYIEGGDLSFHIRKFKKLPEKKIKFWAAEIVLALQHLHECGIVYRDLKPENVLIGSDGHICLTDFGLSKQLDSPDDTTSTICGTPLYLSPEMVNGIQYGKGIDWWSLGVLLFEMFCGFSPFLAEDFPRVVINIRSKALYYPKDLSSQAKSILQGFLERDPSKRLGCGPGGVNHIKSHPFFSSIEWEKLALKKIPCPFINDFKTTQGPIQDDFDPDENEQMKMLDQAVELDGFSYVGFQHNLDSNQ